MIRGILRAKCPECSHKFWAPDIEYGATIESAPVQCPNCGHVFQPGIKLSESSLDKLIDKLKKKFNYR